MTPRDARLAAFRNAESAIRAVAQAALPEIATAMLFRVKNAPTYHERMELSATQKKIVEGQEMFGAVIGPFLNGAVAEDLESGETAEGSSRGDTDWQSLGLVDESRIQDDILQKRIGQLVSHACEAELKALDGYVGALLGLAWADEKRNPLRGDVVGRAVMRAVERLTDVASERKLLAREFGQALAETMPACYRNIIEGFQAEGIQPVSLALRPTDDLPARPDWESSWIGTRPPVQPERLNDFERSLGGRAPAGPDTGGPRGLDTLSSLFDRLMTGGGGGGGGALPGGARTAAQDTAELQLTDLMRRLHVGAAERGFFDAPAFEPTLRDDSALSTGNGASADAPTSELAGLVAVNLIRAHQEQLQRAVRTRHDHLVIEIVGSLFDQILSDPKVPPQLARQMARLQIPVLRVALADTRFFSARQHPVRRFVNRVASLGCAFDRHDVGAGHDLLVRVTSLVDEIVEGDFERIETYEAKLDALQAFVDAQSGRQVAASAAAPVLREKEAEWRVHRAFSRAIAEAVEPLGLPVFVRSFLSGVWAQAIATATRRDGAESETVRRYRGVGLELIASVQPKRSIDDRKRFLVALPPLMSGLHAGMASVDWPQASREAFLGELMTVHAGSLKSTPLSELDHNMRLRHAEAALRTPVPDDVDAGADPSAADPLAADRAASVPNAVAFEPRFSAAEEQALGLVSEGSVDWTSTVPVDDAGDGDGGGGGSGVAAAEAPEGAAVDARPPAGDAGDGDALPMIDLGALDAAPPAPAAGTAGATRAPAPAVGSLRDDLEVGSAYELNLKGRWEKVRLTYMSPSRTLFLFSHGAKDRETVSMTSRVLGRLCDAGRMRAYEREQLVERSTERARRQLSLAPQALGAT